MKKLYMHTIIGSCGRDVECFNYLIAPLYGSKVGLFEGNLFWVAHYNPKPLLTFILKEKLMQY